MLDMGSVLGLFASCIPGNFPVHFRAFHLPGLEYLCNLLGLWRNVSCSNFLAPQFLLRKDVLHHSSHVG